MTTCGAGVVCVGGEVAEDLFAVSDEVIVGGRLGDRSRVAREGRGFLAAALRLRRTRESREDPSEARRINEMFGQNACFFVHVVGERYR